MTDWGNIPRNPWLEMEQPAPQPLTFGEKVAWADCDYGKTDSLSYIHRVQNPDPDEGETFCGKPLPHPKLRFPVLKSLLTCAACERMYWQALTGLTAKSA